MILNQNKKVRSHAAGQMLCASESVWTAGLRNQTASLQDADLLRNPTRTHSLLKLSHPVVSDLTDLLAQAKRAIQEARCCFLENQKIPTFPSVSKPPAATAAGSKTAENNKISRNRFPGAPLEELKDNWPAEPNRKRHNSKDEETTLKPQSIRQMGWDHLGDKGRVVWL